MIKKSLLVVVVLLVLPSKFFAVDPLHRDSAFLLKYPSDIKLLGKEKIIAPAAVEFILSYSKYGSDSLLSPEIDLSAVVLNKIEVTLAVPYLFTRVNTLGDFEKENGISDADIYLKWSFLKKSNTAIALVSDIVLPTGSESKGLGDGSASFMIGGIVSEKLTNLKLSAQLGFQKTGSDFKDFFIYGISGTYNLTEKAIFFAQVKGHTSSVVNNTSNTISAKLGFDYVFTKHFELIIGGVRRITVSGPDYVTFFDFVYSI